MTLASSLVMISPSDSCHPMGLQHCYSPFCFSATYIHLLRDQLLLNTLFSLIYKSTESTRISRSIYKSLACTCTMQLPKRQQAFQPLNWLEKIQPLWARSTAGIQSGNSATSQAPGWLDAVWRHFSVQWCCSSEAPGTHPCQCALQQMQM